MAKRFGGFTPEQLGRIVPEMSGMQADEQAKFLASNPGAAARVGAMTERARMMVEEPVAMAEGGVVAKSTGDANWWEVNGQKFDTLSAAKAAAGSGVTASIPSAPASPSPVVTNQNNPATMDQSGIQPTSPETKNLMTEAVQSPETLVSTAPVQTTTAAQAIKGELDTGAGQISTTAPQAETVTAKQAPTITQADKPATATVESVLAGEDINLVASQTKAAQGQVEREAQVEAQVGNLSAEAMAQEQVFNPTYTRPVDAQTLSVSPSEIATPAGQMAQAITADVAQSDGVAKVVAEQGVVTPDQIPLPAQIREEDMAQAQAITADGLAPDAVAVAARLEKFTVDDGTLAEAVQGKVEAQETVQGQLTQLMKSFDDGTPAWAAGAIRAANAAMASRGLGGSSMMGAAILQAAMESAIPIASQDAQVFQQMKLTNLNNRQQVALTNAAAAQGLALQNLNNEQQAALQNSANAFALQGQNLSNMQQTVLANAQIKAALQGQNLSNVQQANLATAARYAEAANINLNNRQQAALQNNANAMQIELTNMSNRQQSYIANANLAAALQGKQIDTAQQTAIFNAGRFAEAANVTFTAEQQTQLHNSELMKTIGLAELSNSQAVTLQNAAAIANMDMANLDNRQKAAVQNAQAFLAMDMANLDNEQQVALFQAQSRVQALLSDQAVDNATQQFNASSENQVNQFFAGLSAQVSQFNVDQINAMQRFNAGEANALNQFNTSLASQREQFNAANSLIIEQANAQWYQTIATLDNATINQINRDQAAAQNSMTQLGFNAYMQEARDIMSYSWQSANNDADRATSLAQAKINADAMIQAKQMEIEAAERAAAAKKKGMLAGLLGKVAGAALGAIPGIGPVASAAFGALGSGAGSMFSSKN